MLANATFLSWALAACALTIAAGLALYARLSRRSSQLSSRLLEVNSQLDEMRSHDPLTGLVTRPEFETALDAAVLACDRSSAPLALLLVGLDNFRPLNEGYGHRVGDALLVEAARRLQASVGPQRLVARVGGDEFAILLPAALAAAGQAAAELLQALQRPFEAEGLELRLTASIGIAAYPDHGSRPRLLAHATLAMRSVKLNGGAGHTHFDPAMAVDLRDRAELLQDLRHAAERGELQLVYQPKVDARSLQITAAEALLRWQHPRRGMISPTVFVPLAERHGLIAPIGQWVLEEACRQAAQWRERGLRMRVAVNISGHQLRQDDLVLQIESALRRHAIPPGRLTCEITETVAMEDTSQTRAAFERLRQAGLHVSIDDFGTGHSSLAALRRLPAAELKIDRAFVVDLETSERACAIVLAIVQMAHSLNLRVVAEGVETPIQRDVLVELGCDELQGYLFAKPMSAEAVALWADNDDDPGGAGAVFRASLFDPTAHMPLDG
jgi:diguanylate cyclase (GGDEF)-like protein